MINLQRKFHGSGIIAVFLIASTLLYGMAFGLAKLHQSAFAANGSNKIALQAQQYAESKADIVRITKYDDLTAQAKLNITESNYYDEVELSEEITTDTYNQRIATINVYLQGENKPRSILKVLRTNAEKSEGVPIGTIIAWSSNSLPKDGGTWLLCNGQSTTAYPALQALVGNNVPNYQGVFLRGYGSQISTHYGTVTHLSDNLGDLQGDSIRNITGNHRRITWPSNDRYTAGAFYVSNYGSSQAWTGGGESAVHLFFDASRVVPTANENRPVNKAVHWLIKAA